MKIRKDGISLIVLVITLMVMIVLASAIILALVNNGIIDKANKAKQDSNSSALKEYVNVLEVEWRTMSEKERENYASNINYINTKLEEKGYKEVLLVEDGTIYTNLEPNAKEVLKKEIKIGSIVKGYVLDRSKSNIETTGKENTAPEKTEIVDGKVQEISQSEYTTWRYIGVNEDGRIMIVPDMVDNAAKMNLSGKGGYLRGAEELDRVCNTLYSNDKGIARSIDIDDINYVLGYIGEKGAYIKSGYHETKEEITVGEVVKQNNEEKLTYIKTPDEINTWEALSKYKSNYYQIKKSNRNLITYLDRVELVYCPVAYWIASPCAYVYFNYSYVRFCMRYANSNDINANGLFYSNDSSRVYSYAVRPVVEINGDVSVEYDSTNQTLTLN